MINVSVWDSIDAANQMGALPAMRALASDFTLLGVSFERPIINYESSWQI